MANTVPFRQLAELMRKQYGNFVSYPKFCYLLEKFRWPYMVSPHLRRGGTANRRYDPTVIAACFERDCFELRNNR